MRLTAPLRGTAASTQYAVAATYAAQGLGYAAVMTSLPTFKTHLGLSDTAISLVLLGTCLAAAVGSVLADATAVWRGSRHALVGGLAVEAVAVAFIATVPPLPVFLAAVTVYGIGVGMVDASSNMQGVLVQAGSDVPLMGRLYAAYTAAAFGGALVMSAFLASSGAVTGAPVVAALVQGSVAAVGWRLLDHARAARSPRSDTSATPLPRMRIWVVGLVVLVAFALDSSVGTWSSIYLADGLDASKAVAPFGYAAYQLLVLGSRLVADVLVARFGRRRCATGAIITGFAGTLLVAVVDSMPGAIAGFAVCGIAVGILVPIAFSTAGEILPERSDEIVARVNIFNYVGVVVGAAVLGLVAGASLGPAFLIPGVLLLGATTVAHRLG